MNDDPKNLKIGQTIKKYSCTFTALSYYFWNKYVIRRRSASGTFS